MTRLTETETERLHLTRELRGSWYICGQEYAATSVATSVVTDVEWEAGLDEGYFLTLEQ